MESFVWNAGRTRHGRKNNVAFCDGHFDAIQQSAKWNKQKYHYIVATTTANNGAFSGAYEHLSPELSIFFMKEIADSYSTV